ncbi:tetratricopeptide repeat protein [Cytobacillus firmus]|uniref:tetratricopeptide repeat protein n=1 Tax=Cytobacillus firmus TaxID=1399 RepID=UPI001C8D87FE|nr:tetratricopeptide repeat protein [Cytobacillus firmus]MBX9975205.1 tetratricopeptide repeat protein [Cytobacillus firmus]
MRFRNLTLEELENLEQELHENGEQSNYGYYAKLIDIYKEMYKRIVPLVREDRAMYNHSLQYTKKLLVTCLVKYGTYLKVNKLKDDNTAVSSLKKALSYEKNIPIAYYRLGFLAYKQGDYSQAVRYFQEALNYHKLGDDPSFSLNQQQEFHAHMYLANSALYVASSTYEAMEDLSYSSAKQIPNLALSPLYETLRHNEQFLKNHAFYKISKGHIETCSKDTCEEIAENGENNTLGVYFNDRENILFFNGEETIITPGQANMIRHFLLSSNEKNPCTRITMKDFFGRTGTDGEVKKNTFIKSIERLRTRLKTLNMPDIIDVKQYQGETAYYFNETVQYIVLFRVDDAFANDYVS